MEEIWWVIIQWIPCIDCDVCSKVKFVFVAILGLYFSFLCSLQHSWCNALWSNTFQNCFIGNSLIRQFNERGKSNKRWRGVYHLIITYICILQIKTFNKSPSRSWQLSHWLLGSFKMQNYDQYTKQKKRGRAKNTSVKKKTQKERKRKKSHFKNWREDFFRRIPHTENR